MNNVTISFLLTFIAGFSTMIGSILIYIKVKKVDKLICGSLAFASGVMTIVSITDLIPESLILLKTNYSTFIFMVLGIIISMLMDYYLPTETTSSNDKLYKVGLISMLAIILHNIPEDCSCYVSQ